MFDSPQEVAWCLTTYSDWWQPSTSSVMQVGPARRSSEHGDGLHPGVVETLDERVELSRRIALLSERDRGILFRWYVLHQHVDDIAGALRISRRQCFRRRAAALRAIVELGSDSEVA